MGAWASTADGVMLAVRVTPRGGRDAVDGIGQASDGHCHLAVRVRAAPDHGAANQAVLRLIAEFAGIGRSDVTVASGHGARLKRLKLRGDPAAITARLGKAIERRDG